jgi:hypothetical protein
MNIDKEKLDNIEAKQSTISVYFRKKSKQNLLTNKIL